MINADELQEKLTELQGLVNRKKASERALQKIEEEISIVLKEMKSTKKVGYKSRPDGTYSLNNYIIKVMAPGAHMALKTIAEKIMEAGYETMNVKFGSYLHTVITNRDDIRKVRRGVYTRVQSLIQKGRQE